MSAEEDRLHMNNIRMIYSFNLSKALNAGPEILLLPSVFRTALKSAASFQIRCFSLSQVAGFVHFAVRQNKQPEDEKLNQMIQNHRKIH